MIKPTDIQELCQAYLEACGSLEAEFSGDFDGSAEELRSLRHHLEDTFGVDLKGLAWLEEC